MEFLFKFSIVQELDTRLEIPYLQATMHVLLCSLYKYNSPLLTRKSTSLMNENK